MTIKITKLSPAKINLFLEVKNKRNDGYHDIQSLMTFCDFGDMLCVSKSNDFRIKLDGPFSSSLVNKENLIHRTLKKLEDLFERNFNVEVVLKKFTNCLWNGRRIFKCGYLYYMCKRNF